MNGYLKRPGARIATTAVAMILGLAACGSSGSSSGSDNGSTTSSGKSTVTIAVAAAVTGAQGANFGQTVPVAKAWAKYINAHGGIDGHSVNLETFDTQSSLVTAKTVADEIVANKSVAAAIWADGITDGEGVKILNAAGIPVVGTEGYDPAFGTLKNVWQPTLDGLNVLYSSAGAIAALHIKTLYNFVCAEAPVCLQSNAGIEAAAKVLGVKDIGVSTIAAASPSYTAQCLDAIHSGAQAIIPGVVEAAAVRLIQQCIQQGWKGAIILIATAITPSVVAAAKGLKIIGIIDGFPTYANNPGVKTYVAAMQADGLSQTVYGADIAPGTWESLQLLNYAITKAKIKGDVTAADVIKAYGQVKNYTMGGLLPQPVSFTSNTAQNPPMTCFWLETSQNGSAFTEYPGGMTPTCLPKSLG